MQRGADIEVMLCDTIQHQVHNYLIHVIILLFERAPLHFQSCQKSRVMGTLAPIAYALKSIIVDWQFAVYCGWLYMLDVSVSNHNTTHYYDCGSGLPQPMAMNASAMQPQLSPEMFGLRSTQMLYNQTSTNNMIIIMLLYVYI